MDITQLSTPPTEEELEKFTPVDPQSLPPKYTRDINSRIFVNRSVNFDNIEYIGCTFAHSLVVVIKQNFFHFFKNFLKNNTRKLTTNKTKQKKYKCTVDMDYTLAVYNSPAFEDLQISLTIERLIKRGYPKEIANIHFKPGFSVRGLFLDKKLGNLLHLDNFGFIMACVHGFRSVKLHDPQLLEWYPEKIVHPSDFGKRYYCFDTLFGLYVVNIICLFVCIQKQENGCFFAFSPLPEFFLAPSHLLWKLTPNY